MVIHFVLLGFCDIKCCSAETVRDAYAKVTCISRTPTDPVQNAETTPFFVQPEISTFRPQPQQGCDTRNRCSGKTTRECKQHMHEEQEAGWVQTQAQHGLVHKGVTTVCMHGVRGKVA